MMAGAADQNLANGGGGGGVQSPTGSRAFPQSGLGKGLRMVLRGIHSASDNEQPDHDLFRVFYESIECG